MARVRVLDETLQVRRYVQDAERSLLVQFEGYGAADVPRMEADCS